MDARPLTKHESRDGERAPIMKIINKLLHAWTDLNGGRESGFFPGMLENIHNINHYTTISAILRLNKQRTGLNDEYKKNVL